MPVRKLFSEFLCQVSPPSKRVKSISQFVNEPSLFDPPAPRSLEQQTSILHQEVQVFLLAPALMWCMWAVVRSQDADVNFGFWVSSDFPH